MNEAGQQALLGAYWGFTEAANNAGVNKGGDALMPTSMATTVRVRDGKTMTTGRSVCRNQRAVGRLLRPRLRQFGRGHRVACQNSRRSPRLD